LFFNIGIALLTAGDINVTAFAIVIALAAGMACCTPPSALPAPLFYGPGHITMQNSIKCNVIFVALSFVVLIAFVLPFASAVFRI